MQMNKKFKLSFLKVGALLACLTAVFCFGFSLNFKKQETSALEASSYLIEAEPFAGSGSYDSPYLIGTAGQLAKLANDVNNNGNSYSGKHFKLTANIDLAGKIWTPIGSGWIESLQADRCFSGIFDGDGYTISNMYIDPTVQVNDYALFGAISGATIKNLQLTNINIYATNGKDKSHGGLVGLVATGSTGNKIEACYVTGSTNCEGNEGSLVGAVGAFNATGNTEITISRCWTNVSFVGSSYPIVGKTTAGASITISNCYAVGDIGAMGNGSESNCGICAGAGIWFCGGVPGQSDSMGFSRCIFDSCIFPCA